MDEKSKSIEVTQKKDYDSEFCGSIPLNFINLIQPHGILMVIEKNQYKIVQVSENIESIIGIKPEQIINKSLSSFIDAHNLNQIKEKVSQYNIKDKVPMDLDFFFQEKTFHFSSIVHFKEEYILTEWEERNEEDNRNSFRRIYQETRLIISAVKESKNIEELGKIVTTEIRKLSDFDRVMIYKFDSQWNGKVIAESKIKSLEPYLNLQFPASDIPRQARDLYFKNPFRLIPNAVYVPSKLVPIINPITHSFTDLSECNLRSVPKVHIEYLENMGVKASMSIPIIIRKKLWGLISCHNIKPKYLNYEMRAAFELLSEIISAQIRARETEDFLRNKAENHKIFLLVLEQIYRENDFIEGLTKGEVTIQNFLNCSGVAIFYENNLYKIGSTPHEDEMDEIINWLNRNNFGKIFSTDSLPALFDKALLYKDVASGLLSIDIEAYKGNVILCFRGEMDHTVIWGGNPNTAINFSPDNKGYRPRNSFAAWKESVKNSSKPWTKIDLEGAENLRNSLIEKTLREKGLKNS